MCLCSGEVFYIKVEFFCAQCLGQCVEQRGRVACLPLTLIMARRGQQRGTDRRWFDVVQRLGVREYKIRRESFGCQKQGGALYRASARKG